MLEAFSIPADRFGVRDQLGTKKGTTNEKGTPNVWAIRAQRWVSHFLSPLFRVFPGQTGKPLEDVIVGRKAAKSLTFAGRNRWVAPIADRWVAPIAAPIAMA